MTDAKFKVGDKVERIHEGVVWYTAKVTRFYEDDDTSCQVRVIDPGARTNVQKGQRLYPELENLRPVKPKKRRIQQLEAKLEQAAYDVADVQRRLNEANRRYGKASKTIGELRGRLAQRALLAMAEPTSTAEPARLVTVGTEWDAACPGEPDLPVGSQVKDRDGDVWTLDSNGKWRYSSWLPRDWSHVFAEHHPLTLVSFGGG